MVSISEIMLPLSMFLTILLASKFKAGESGFFTDNVKVIITNKLTNMQLGVHCKDKTHDLGFQALQIGQSYSFQVTINFRKNKLYFCSFNWITDSHYFDIYDQFRDEYCEELCSWEIFETGPCQINAKTRQCYAWNKSLLGGRQLNEGNNTLGV
ncbi:S-protein homolog 2-like [Gastrolobium bilobum]|uniref:S-protein homolog 2-like n=1 Tax=Gastrolobium bilobum TaxID=150636 RepID=UPI002AAF7E4C|nr:S-protein homolog 2-like [Gastrolobium bilobum]